MEICLNNNDKILSTYLKVAHDAHVEAMKAEVAMTLPG